MKRCSLVAVYISHWKTLLHSSWQHTRLSNNAPDSSTFIMKLNFALENSVQISRFCLPRSSIFLLLPFFFVQHVFWSNTPLYKILHSHASYFPVEHLYNFECIVSQKRVYLSSKFFCDGPFQRNRLERTDGRIWAVLHTEGNREEGQM
jgi:hypothetical protein